MKNYSLEACQKLIDRYIGRGGEVEEIREGILGLGKLVLTGEGLKTIIIEEVYINEWSSGHTIRKYNKTPKKYLALT